MLVVSAVPPPLPPKRSLADDELVLVNEPVDDDDDEDGYLVPLLEYLLVGVDVVALSERHDDEGLARIELSGL